MWTWIMDVIRMFIYFALLRFHLQGSWILSQRTHPEYETSPSQNIEKTHRCRWNVETSQKDLKESSIEPTKHQLFKMFHFIMWLP